MNTIKLTKSDRAILESYKGMLDGLTAYLGPGYEILLHSLESFEHSAIKVINGHYTGRTEGAPITDLALRMLGEIERSGDVHKSLTYFTKNQNGAPIRSTTIPITGENDKLIGLLCINFYMDISFHRFMESFLPMNNPEQTAVETFAVSAEEQLQQAVETAKRSAMDDTSIPTTQKNKHIITDLYQQHLFQIKNAPEIVARLLGISKNTVYMHLRNLGK